MFFQSLSIPLLLLLLLLLLLSVGPSSGLSVREEETTLSPYFTVSPVEGVTTAVNELLVLKGVNTEVSCQGIIAQVKIVQLYENVGEHPLAAQYVFPASTKATVYGMQMYLNGNLVVGTIYPKNEAQELYDEAIEEGKTASLLEQVRPNMFSMSLGNVLPQDLIRVEIFYTEELVPVGGEYTFHYPLSVGSRYQGESEGTLPVSTVNPEVFLFKISIDGALPIESVSYPTHNFITDEATEQFVSAHLDPDVPTAWASDIKIVFSFAGNDIVTGLMLYRGTNDNGEGGPFRIDADGDITWDLPASPDEGFFLAHMQPPSPTFVSDFETPRREYIFILDRSGSMRGYPLELSKSIFGELMGSLRPDFDYFNLVSFASDTPAVFSSHSLIASNANVDRAVSAFMDVSSTGGTNVLEALNVAFNLPLKEAGELPVSRTYVILTDGYVTVETETFVLVKNSIKDANFFAFSIGLSPNRYLTQGIAKVGKGSEYWVRDTTDAAYQIPQFLQFVSSPLLTNVQVEYHAEVLDVASVPGILLAERPLVLTGRFTEAPAPGSLFATVTGKLANGDPWENQLSTPLTEITPKYRALRYLWARSQVDDLEYTLLDQYYAEEDSPGASAITALGVNYNILTRFTSFLAIFHQVRVLENQSAVTSVDHPLPLLQSANSTDSSVNNTSINSPGTSHYDSGGQYFSSARRVDVTGVVFFMSVFASMLFAMF